MSHSLSRMVFLALVAACPAALAAEDLQWIAPDGLGQDSVLTSYGPAAPAAKAAACCEQDACGGCGLCDSCCGGGCGADCEECPRLGLVIFAGLDSFKGVSDGTWQSNFGIVNGVNTGIPLGQSGFGWQVGMSYGIYDFEGRDSSFVERSATQEQVFITTGFFRKARNGGRLSFGLVYDWAINNNWGVAATDNTLGQWRGQVEFALNSRSAIGVYGVKSDRRDNQLQDVGFLLPVLFRTRPMDQINVFYHHKFLQGADGKVWFGIPDRDAESGFGSLGEWIAGCQIEIPLSQRLALYAGGQYMKPSASAGDGGGAWQDAYDIAIGLAFYPGRNACTHVLNGSCSVPYLPVANNSTFLVDQFPTD